MTETLHPLAEACEKLGLSLQSSSPLGEVKDNWPCISYACQLVRNGSVIWSGPYSLGVGHVKLPAGDAWRHDRLNKDTRDLTDDERSVLHTLKTRPGVIFKNFSLVHHATLAGKLANAQKVAPKLTDVVHSLLSDGSPFFQGQTFEEWAGDFGYDADSRKAEETYKACDAIGRQLSKAFTADELKQLQEAGQDY